MSLIVGLNLSNKIYLAADTRITYKPSGKKIDNVLKIIPLWGRNILDQGVFNDDYISMGAVGDVELSTFLHNGIKDLLREKKLSSNIRELYNSIDSYVAELINKWTLELQRDHRECCLVFTGIIAGTNKMIDKETLKQLINVFESGSSVDKNKAIPDMEKLINEDPTWQLINNKMMKEAGKTVLDSLNESFIPEVPEYINKTVESDSNKLSDFFDSFMFAISINTAGIYKKDKAEWGEFLAFGSKGINKDSLPEHILSVLELGRGKKNNLPNMFESAIVSMTIVEFAKTIETIGDNVFINIINCKKILGKNERRTEIGSTKNFIPPDCININGKIEKLKFFTKFTDSLKQGASATL